MAKQVGYARVSTEDRCIQLQLDALKEAGCLENLVFVDQALGARADRPGLDACLATLEPGDTLLVWRLDRLGRSMPHLVMLIEDLFSRQIGFRSLCDDAIDTTMASGELIFKLFSALAQFERRLIQERTKAGRAAARARGRTGGRRPLLPTDSRVQMAKRMHGDHDMNISEICRTLKISRATFYRYVALPEAIDDNTTQSR